MESMTISELIAALRERGYTQAQLQDMTDIPQARISKWAKPGSTHGRSANDVLKLVAIHKSRKRAPR